MKTELEERLKQEAQIQAQEARSHRATVREIYQAVTGRTGEPGDWNGAKPVMALIEERDALRDRVDELSRAYAVQGLALEELTAERDRYREALRPFAALDPDKWGSEERVAILAARAALKEPTK